MLYYLGVKVSVVEKYWQEHEDDPVALYSFLDRTVFSLVLLGIGNRFHLYKV